MNTVDTLRITPKLVVGFGIVTLGVLWTLDNLNVLEAEPIVRFWPVLLIVIGALQLMSARALRAGPIALMILGAVMLLDVLDWVDVDVRDLIPLAIALFGAKLIHEALGRKRRTPADGNDTVHAFAMMSGVKHQSAARDFQGGDANAIMGGVELDLRDAHIATGAGVIVDAFAFWGAVEIIVPRNWKVLSQVVPVMGAYEDNTKPNGEPGPTLTIRGTAIMGAIEVKS